MKGKYTNITKCKDLLYLPGIMHICLVKKSKNCL